MAISEEHDTYNKDVLNGHLAGSGMPEQPARSLHQLSIETDAYIQQVEAEIVSLGDHGSLVRALAERGQCSTVQLCFIG